MPHPGLWIFGLGLLVGMLLGCVLVHGGRGKCGQGASQVVVRCTLEATSGTPCQDEAARDCRGRTTPRLVAIRSQAKIPVPDQHGAPLYQYQAAYACGAGGRP